MNSIIITAIIAVTVIIVAAIIYKTIDGNSNTAFNNAIMNYEANDKKAAHELRLSYESAQKYSKKDVISYLTYIIKKS